MGVEDKYRESVTIVYPVVALGDEFGLPIDREIRTHVTVSFLGNTNDLEGSREELVSVLKAVEWQEVGDAEVEGLELFGPSSDFLVMTLRSAALHANQNNVRAALRSIGVLNSDKYTDYRPHLTLMHEYAGELPLSPSLPRTVKVCSPVLWWGSEAIPLN